MWGIVDGDLYINPPPSALQARERRDGKAEVAASATTSAAAPPAPEDLRLTADYRAVAPTVQAYLPRFPSFHFTVSLSRVANKSLTIKSL